MCFGTGLITLHELLKVIVVTLCMAVGVHGHKASVLQEARINTAPGACERSGHTVDYIVLKPFN